MAILLPTESKSFKGRLIHGSIILVLLLGAVTMVYPFLVMLSGSVRSQMDESDLDLVPDYLVDDTALYRKFLEFKYNQDINALNRAHQSSYYSFRDVEPPDHPGTLADPLNIKLADGDETPFHFYVLGGIQSDRTVQANLRRIRDRLKTRFDGDINAYIEAGGDPVPNWLAVVMAPPRWFDKRYDFPAGPLFEEYLNLARERVYCELQPVSLAGHFLEVMVYPQHGRGDEALEVLGLSGNQHGFEAFALPLKAPTSGDPRFRELWVDYVRNEVNPSFLYVKPPAAPEELAHPTGGLQEPFFMAFTPVQHQDGGYVRHLEASYSSIEELSASWGRELSSFADAKVVIGRWLRGVERQDYAGYLDTVPIDSVRVFDPRDVVHGDPMTTAILDWAYTLTAKSELRKQFAARNYINVWDELVGEGRALVNTIVYCALSIVLALLINPLAAYGLSRFKLRGGYKFLLILMATMAFPPMVTLIPQFILLRNLGLMNTFVALLLPLVANGYLIFLLKGFFDSLPSELYEAARIDGASEGRMFFQIAMALSKPILAVVALQTFTAAYTMFLYALLVAPDRDMWLISVWLFQFQQRASSSGVYASVVIASIPTLMLFLLVQRTIMRGIVVPTEK